MNEHATPQMKNEIALISNWAKDKDGVEVFTPEDKKIELFFKDAAEGLYGEAEAFMEDVLKHRVDLKVISGGEKQLEMTGAG